MKIYRIQPMAGPYEGNVFYCERLEDLATALETAGDACLVSVQYVSRKIYDDMPTTFQAYQMFCKAARGDKG